MSMTCVTLEIKNCRVSGTFEYQGHDGIGSVCQFDMELSIENAASIWREWPVGPAAGPHNHTEYVKPRDKEAIRQMAERFNGAPMELEWVPVNGWR